MTRLTGPLIARLVGALADAYNPAKFEQLLLGKLDRKLARYSKGGDFEDVLQQVVQRANEEEWVEELLEKARLDRPRDEEIAAIARLIGSVPPKRPRFITNRDGVRGLSHTRLGSIHLHIDGAHAKDVVDVLITEHEDAHYTTELTSVAAFVAGPEREELVSTYQVHTPGSNGTEKLDFFSTTLIHEGPELPDLHQWLGVRSLTRDALVYLDDADREGVVMELERVVGTVDRNGEPSVATPLQIPSSVIEQFFEADALLFKPDKRLLVNARRAPMYELHFAVDIPRSGNRAPLELDDLLALSNDADVSVGGWFLFVDEHRWAYRSNSFVPRVSEKLLRDEWKKLSDALKSSPLVDSRQCRVRLLAEESIAVWKSPLDKANLRLLTVPELAQWEQERPDLAEFWVVAPNFLGDQVEQVKQAMQSNLARGVKYVYFLRSEADAKRWLAFKREMLKVAGASGRLDAYVIDFVEPQAWQNIAFIANPAREDQQGMRLRIDPLTQKIESGFKMRTSELESLVKALKPLVDARKVSKWRRVLDEPPEEKLAAICVAFASPDTIRLVDAGIAKQFSSQQGEIRKHDERTLVAVFHGMNAVVTRAVRCAADVIRLVKESGGDPGVRLGIDYAGTRKVTRSYGYEWEGEAVTGCMEVLEKVGSKQGIFLTARAARECKDPYPDLELKELNRDIFQVVETTG